MQSAETVLGVLRERGRRGLPLKELYRQLFNPQLYLLAYGRIYADKGAMTPGASGETVDGMSIGKIEALWYERYRLSPVKRIHIPKKNGKTTRPLGLPPWSDKLVDEVVRLLLDDFVEKVLIPHCTRERIRRQDTAYARVRAARERAHKRGDHATARELRKQLWSMPSGDPRDPGFRRLRYVRYCDDILLGFTGPKAEAEEIKQRLTAFLRDELALELSADKTLITHARTQAARFLSYEIIVLHNDRKVTRGRRSANGVVSLKVPASVIKARKTAYLSRGKTESRPRLINEDDHTIVNTNGAEWRGIVQYYLLAGNVHRLHRLGWVMETSLLKTLASKHRSSVAKMARIYAATITTPHGATQVLRSQIERSGRKPLVVDPSGIDGGSCGWKGWSPWPVDLLRIPPSVGTRQS
ncbi:group II intron reverse transcriptase/maturase [Nonomuraea sp. NPDC049625]|uniref:group II intron reverse transcriptase/maturase n=1 Tax=Nonomuraea sp. NPDC049625 TaxID=3155775 RepID=UPI003422FE8A